MLSQLLAKIRGSEPEEQEREQTLPMAAAALFFEVAWADHEITEHELELVRAAIMSQFGLSIEVVDEIVEESHKQHDNSVGVYPFTRAITEAWDEQQRFELVVQLWQLALSNEELNRYEEHTIRRIADLLYLSHQRFIEAKLKVKRSGGA
ncbi:MAG: TerB family tellurite resistance protein [Gammaproteobacteria bacterium]|nr:TerB family tellurite resistance protein [Gammaproteobacteria bacterium]